MPNNCAFRSRRTTKRNMPQSGNENRLVGLLYLRCTASSELARAAVSVGSRLGVGGLNLTGDSQRKTRAAAIMPST